MTGPRGLRRDDRGVSVALSHVLTMGITAVLIAGLLMGASAMLDGQSERGAERSLETIGERVASEVASVDRLAREEPEPGIVELRVDHPNEVSGTTYSIELREGNCGELIASGVPCVVLNAPGARTTVYVPLAVNDDPGIVSGTNAQGGEMRISYEEGESGITLESGHE